MTEKPLPLSLRLMIKAEIFIMTRLVPASGPGPVFKWLFKLPVLLNKISLGRLNSDHFLLLTTTGRKTGLPRQTALEYLYEPETDSCVIMAGWGGRTDWVRNIQANPRVQVQLKGRKFEALAEPVSQEEVAARLQHVVKVNPDSLRMWSRWAGEPLDGSEDSLFRAAKHFPSLRLVPVKKDKTKQELHAMLTR